MDLDFLQCTALAQTSCASLMYWLLHPSLGEEVLNGGACLVYVGGEGGVFLRENL